MNTFGILSPSNSSAYHSSFRKRQHEPVYSYGSHGRKNNRKSNRARWTQPITMLDENELGRLAAGKVTKNNVRLKKVKVIKHSR